MMLRNLREIDLNKWNTWIFHQGTTFRWLSTTATLSALRCAQRNKNCNWYFAFAGVGLGPNRNCRWLNYKRLSTTQPHLTVALVSFVTITLLSTVQNIAQLRHLDIIHEANGKLTTNRLCDIYASFHDAYYNDATLLIVLPLSEISQYELSISSTYYSQCNDNTAIEWHTDDSPRAVEINHMKT